MKKILLLFFISLVWTSCQDDIGLNTSGGDVAEGMTDIYLSQPDATAITTRAGEDEAANRIENVVLFVFDDKGDLVNTPVQQSVTVADGNHDLPTYKVRTYLPSNKSSLYAVCNYDEADDLIANVNSVTDLKSYVVEIESVEDAFKGVYVMEGYTNNFTGNIKVPVTRIAARHTFSIKFAPDNTEDEFQLINLSVFNVPNQTKLLKDENYQCEDDANGLGCLEAKVPEAETGYLGVDIEPGKTPGDDYVNIDFTMDADGYHAELNTFENRQGRIEDGVIDDALGIKDYPQEDKNAIRQIFKKDLAEGKSPFDNTKRANPTCLVIEGIYKDAANNISSEVRYYIYLGHNNYSDFNVVRNHNYAYAVTIKACDVIDTRVLTNTIEEVSFKVSKENQPFDAHYNAREALIYSSARWKVYVKEPDKTPWLEVSTSPVYKPRKLGSSADDSYAQFSLSGGAGMQYIYIHTDEYVPDINEVSENENWESEASNRKGEIVCVALDDDGNPIEATKQTFTVIQVPALLVEITAWDINLAKEVTHKFFVERIEEERYKDWGFRGYWNQTLDNLITTGQYNGLSTTRKEYVSAYWGDEDSDSFKAREELGDKCPLEGNIGRQNAAYWLDADEETDGFQPNVATLYDNLSTTFALGYALSKNRDRNGNGRIDYNEILWYLPGVQQLEGIYEAVKAKTLDLKPEGKTYWSSTPSVSDRDGITPGRAYYVDLTTGKRAIGLRSQSMGVIVCRNIDGWLGPETGSGSGSVGTEDNWGNEEDVNMPKPDIVNSSDDENP
mgnify:CR=1 FL=1